MRHPGILVASLLLAPAALAEPLAWLAGCWQSEDGRTKEVWVVESGDALLGFSANVTDGRIGFYELMRIHRDADGSWVFTAWPSGQSSASFRSVSVTANAISFANPGHDFPQEIHYRRAGGRLEASVSLSGGEERTRFDRVRCE